MSNLRMNLRVVGLLISFLIMTAIGAQAQEPTTKPITIDEAVRMALSNNLIVQTAREDVNIARARLSGARADRLPQVDASVEYRRISSPPTFDIPITDPNFPTAQIITTPKDSLVGTIAARQAIYTGGRIQGQITRTEALLDAAISRFLATEAQVALQTRQAYYSVLLAQSLVISAEENLKAARAQLETATVRFEVGTAAMFDVFRAQTQVSEAEQRLVEAQNQAENSRVALNRILGAPLGTVFILEQPGPASLPAEELPALIDIAERQRSEILAARSQLEAARAGIRVAQSERLPSLNVAANYQVASEESFGQATGWTFIATASMEIFDGGRTRANVSEARSLTEQARINVENTERAVEQDVRQAYTDLQTNLQTIQTARARLSQAQEAYDIAVVRYQAGVGTAVEIADALASLASARTNLDQATYNYNVAYARLQRASGRATY